MKEEVVFSDDLVEAPAGRYFKNWKSGALMQVYEQFNSHKVPKSYAKKSSK